MRCMVLLCVSVAWCSQMPCACLHACPAGCKVAMPPPGYSLLSLTLWRRHFLVAEAALNAHAQSDVRWTIHPLQASSLLVWPLQWPSRVPRALCSWAANQYPTDTIQMGLKPTHLAAAGAAEGGGQAAGAVEPVDPSRCAPHAVIGCVVLPHCLLVHCAKLCGVHAEFLRQVG